MIHVFSATGNSLQIAEELSSRTGMGVVRITDSNGTVDDGIVFIVCPVYFYTIPDIVKEYVSKSDFSRSERIVLVLNYGTTPGNASGSAVTFFRRCGMELDRVFPIKMPENYVPMFDPPSEDSIHVMVKSVPERVSELLAHLEDGTSAISGASLFHRLLTIFGHPVYDIIRTTRRFKTSSGCTGCGMCEKACPRHVISIEDGRPVWNERRCEHCMACVNRCPSDALRYGRSGSRRYLNPVTGRRLR